MNYWLLSIPFISAVIGWGINTILIQLLFYPLIPRKILGISFHGLILRYQQTLANKVAKFVISQTSFQEVEQKFTHPDIIEKLMPYLEEEIDNFLRNKLSVQMPMLSMFIGDKTIAQLKEVFIAELRTLFPKLISNYIATIQSGSTLELLISQKIAAISPVLITDSIRAGLRKQIRLFRLAGIVTGFLIGFMQVMILFFLS